MLIILITNINTFDYILNCYLVLPAMTRDKDLKEQTGSCMVFVRNSEKKAIKLALKSPLLGKDLLNKIYQKMKVKKQQGCVFLEGKIIKQDQTLLLHKGLIFYLIDISKLKNSQITVNVKRIQPHAPTHSFLINSNTKIKQFLATQFKQKFNGEQNYFLFYLGRQMSPNQSFYQNYVTDGSQILAIHKLENLRKRNQCKQVQEVVPLKYTNNQINNFKMNNDIFGQVDQSTQIRDAKSNANSLNACKQIKGSISVLSSIKSQQQIYQQGANYNKKHDDKEETIYKNIPKQLFETAKFKTCQQLIKQQPKQSINANHNIQPTFQRVQHTLQGQYCQQNIIINNKTSQFYTSQDNSLRCPHPELETQTECNLKYKQNKISTYYGLVPKKHKEQVNRKQEQKTLISSIINGSDASTSNMNQILSCKQNYNIQQKQEDPGHKDETGQKIRHSSGSIQSNFALKTISSAYYDDYQQSFNSNIDESIAINFESVDINKLILSKRLKRDELTVGQVENKSGMFQKRYSDDKNSRQETNDNNKISEIRQQDEMSSKTEILIPADSDQHYKLNKQDTKNGQKQNQMCMNQCVYSVNQKGVIRVELPKQSLYEQEMIKQAQCRSNPFQNTINNQIIYDCVGHQINQKIKSQSCKNQVKDKFNLINIRMTCSLQYNQIDNNLGQARPSKIQQNIQQNTIQNTKVQQKQIQMQKQKNKINEEQIRKEINDQKQKQKQNAVGNGHRRQISGISEVNSVYQYSSGSEIPSASTLHSYKQSDLFPQINEQNMRTSFNSDCMSPLYNQDESSQVDRMSMGSIKSKTIFSLQQSSHSQTSSQPVAQNARQNSLKQHQAISSLSVNSMKKTNKIQNIQNISQKQTYRYDTIKRTISMQQSKVQIAGSLAYSSSSSPSNSIPAQQTIISRQSNQFINVKVNADENEDHFGQQNQINLKEGGGVFSMHKGRNYKQQKIHSQHLDNDCKAQNQQVKPDQTIYNPIHLLQNQEQKNKITQLENHHQSPIKQDENLLDCSQQIHGDVEKQATHPSSVIKIKSQQQLLSENQISSQIDIVCENDQSRDIGNNNLLNFIQNSDKKLSSHQMSLKFDPNEQSYFNMPMQSNKIVKKNLPLTKNGMSLIHFSCKGTNSTNDLPSLCIGDSICLTNTYALLYTNKLNASHEVQQETLTHSSTQKLRKEITSLFFNIEQDFRNKQSHIKNQNQHQQNLLE